MTNGLFTRCHFFNNIPWSYALMIHCRGHHLSTTETRERCQKSIPRPQALQTMKDTFHDTKVPIKKPARNIYRILAFRPSARPPLLSAEYAKPKRKVCQNNVCSQTPVCCFSWFDFSRRKKYASTDVMYFVTRSSVTSSHKPQDRT